MDRILAASAFDSGEEGRCVLELFTDEGVRRCELSVSVSMPETSEDAHAVLILRDVEDRLAAEDRLRETLRQVEEARSRTVSLTAAIVDLKDSFTGQHQRRTVSDAGLQDGLRQYLLQGMEPEAWHYVRPPRPALRIWPR